MSAPTIATTRSTATRSHGFRADIQGLRAIAVAAVVLDHAGVPGARGGFVGVDVFFAISGFLITQHLVGRLEATGTVGFAEFYARRARRILPAAFTVLALTAAVMAPLLPPTLLPQAFRDAASVALYVPNYVLAIRGTDYLANPTPSVFQHYWSLGVEEQFYLLWPALLALAWWNARRMLRTPRRRRLAVAVVLAVLAAASLASNLYETRHSEPWAFFSLWTRAWELAGGGLVALAAPALARRMPRAVALPLGWAGLAGIVAACVLYNAKTVFPGTAVLLPSLASCAVIAAGCAPARAGAAAGVARILGARPLLFLGEVSYSLYLVHWPVLQLAQAKAGYAHPLPLWLTGLLALACVPLAWLLNRLVENPVRVAKPLAGARPRRSLLAALGSSAVLVAVCVAASIATAVAPLQSARVAAPAALTAPPIATAYVPSNLTPTLRAAADDNPIMYADGCELGFSASIPQPCSFGDDQVGADAPELVLFGDSQAAQWQPGLQPAATAQGYRLVTQTKSGCASTLVSHVRNGAPYPSCDQWRENVLHDMQQDPPAVLVLADYDDEDVPSGDAPQTQWAKGLADTIAQVPASTRIVLLADSPDLGMNPVDCLSAHLTDAAACAPTKTKALDEPGRMPVQQAAATTRADLVDLTGYFCGTTCPAVIGDTLVYRDSHHLTATFSAKLAPLLQAGLEKVLTSAG